MASKKSLIAIVAISVGIFEILAPSVLAWAGDREKVLLAFDGNNGALPVGGLVFDTSGNLYGTTQGGGDPSCEGGCGVVFKLTPYSNGKWTETVLHRFNGKDGGWPSGTLILDAVGNLYGTTYFGGKFTQSCPRGGCGTVFSLTPNADGTWAEHALHRFNGKDGSSPTTNLVFDPAGNLYGATPGGFGSPWSGAVFKMARGANDKWTYSLLHTFHGANPPPSAVILDTAGNLYGHDRRERGKRDSLRTNTGLEWQVDQEGTAYLSRGKRRLRSPRRPGP